MNVPALCFVVHSYVSACMAVICWSGLLWAPNPRNPSPRCGVCGGGRPLMTAATRLTPHGGYLNLLYLNNSLADKVQC